jgi:hypothetical protein
MELSIWSSLIRPNSIPFSSQTIKLLFLVVKCLLLVCSTSVYTIQNRNDVISVMYNQSNVTTCLKCKTKILKIK